MDPFDKLGDDVKLKDDEGSVEKAINKAENLCESSYNTYLMCIRNSEKFTIESSLKTFICSITKTLEFSSKDLKTKETMYAL